MCEVVSFVCTLAFDGVSWVCSKVCWGVSWVCSCARDNCVYPAWNAIFAAWGCFKVWLIMPAYNWVAWGFSVAVDYIFMPIFRYALVPAFNGVVFTATSVYKAFAFVLSGLKNHVVVPIWAAVGSVLAALSAVTSAVHFAIVVPIVDAISAAARAIRGVVARVIRMFS